MAKDYKKISGGFEWEDTLASINPKASLFMIYAPAKAIKEFNISKKTKLKIKVEIIEEDETEEK